MDAPQYAEVAINLHGVEGTYDYEIPAPLTDRLQPGHLVITSFNARSVQGIVVALHATPSVENTLPLDSLVDDIPVLTSHQIRLARWMHENTRTALIDCLTVMLPPGLSQKADSLYTLLADPDSPLSPSQALVLQQIQSRGPLSGRQLQRALRRKNWRKAAENLVRRGILSRRSVLEPARSGARKIRTARLAVPPEQLNNPALVLGKPSSATPQRRRAILDLLVREGEPIDLTWIYAETGAKRADLLALEQMELVALGESELWRDPLATYDYVPASPPILTADQEMAWEQIRKACQASETESPKPILLHGVTGSGKTELYMRAAAEVIRQGRSAIILVPEIALTPQATQRFLARFPGRVGLMHSQLTVGERYDTWRRCREGKINILIGARSALFAPLEHIGLIVLDESHDSSFKQADPAPRYHARSTALAYARMTGAACILGSATPDLVTMHSARSGALQLIRLPNRILAHQQRLSDQSSRLGVPHQYQPAGEAAVSRELPPVRIIDMRQELRAGNTSLFSRALTASLDEVIRARQQAILFLNRRGSSTYIFCRDCGWVFRCPQCEIPLTHHEDEALAICHHCDFHAPPPEHCPVCGSARVKFFGAGTQRIQAELERAFPGVQTIRWDQDSARSRGSHEIILANFSSHKADVLIGTQMIAKGLDLPLVTLVGIISADAGLNFPDYRMVERTFQTLTQVAGRAGRGLLDGRVILQTFQPEHPVIRSASQHDYEHFYQVELDQRKKLDYPPYTRLVKLIYRSTSQRDASSECARVAQEIRSIYPAVSMIGPAPCFYRRLRGYHRWQIIIRGSDPLSILPPSLPAGWIVDIDPVSLL